MIGQNISDKGSFSPKANSLWIIEVGVVTGLSRTNGDSCWTAVANDGCGVRLSPPLPADG